MSYNFKLHLICAIAMAALMFTTVRSVNKERHFWGPEKGYHKYKAFTNILMLPTYLTTWVVMRAMFEGWAETCQWLLTTGFGILFSITVYYLVLIPLQAVFRRHFSARTCAMLWIMPTLLYICVIGELTEWNRPLLVIPGSSEAVRIAGIIWLVGFLGVMLWKIGSHLLFRHQITSTSRKITDEAILNLWTAEQIAAGMHPLLPLTPVYSDVVQTPLSIGFIDTTILLVLPDRSYTQDDLKLIFQHEIIHIQRKDSQTKLFMAFCAALCWFNPFMWKSLQTCTSDLELSCDETLLADADEATRHHYGQLLLHTAGDSRGFTTCLSASAESMRYRLKHVMMPHTDLRRGSFIMALIAFLLVMSVGFVSLSYEQLPAGQVLASKTWAPGITAESPVLYSVQGYGDCQITDAEALHQYIQSIEVHKITGYYRFDLPDEYLCVPYVTERGKEFKVYLTEDSLLINRYDFSDMYRESYYITQDIDWDYIESLLEPS